MGLDDKIKNAAQDISGKAKEAVGKHSDNERLEAEGQNDQFREAPRTDSAGALCCAPTVWSGVQHPLVSSPRPRECALSARWPSAWCCLAERVHSR
jgi:hypothetical protein